MTLPSPLISSADPSRAACKRSEREGERQGERGGERGRKSERGWERARERVRGSRKEKWGEGERKRDYTHVLEP